MWWRFQFPNKEAYQILSCMDPDDFDRQALRHSKASVSSLTESTPALNYPFTLLWLKETFHHDHAHAIHLQLYSATCTPVKHGQLQQPTISTWRIDQSDHLPDHSAFVIWKERNLSLNEILVSHYGILLLKILFILRFLVMC